MADCSGFFIWIISLGYVCSLIFDSAFEFKKMLTRKSLHSTSNEPLSICTCFALIKVILSANFIWTVFQKNPQNLHLNPSRVIKIYYSFYISIIIHINYATSHFLPASFCAMLCYACCLVIFLSAFFLRLFDVFWLFPSQQVGKHIINFSCVMLAGRRKNFFSSTSLLLDIQIAFHIILS